MNGANCELENVVLAVWNVKNVYDCKKITCRFHMSISLNRYYCFEHIIREKIVAIFMHRTSVVLVWLS